MDPMQKEQTNPDPIQQNEHIICCYKMMVK